METVERASKLMVDLVKTKSVENTNQKHVNGIYQTRHSCCTSKFVVLFLRRKMHPGDNCWPFTPS